MADPSYLKTFVQGLKDRDTRAALERVIDELCRNLRFGRCQAQTRAENLQLYAIEGRTHATPDTEFSIAHGLGVAPYLLIPVLPLDTVHAEIVPLRVTRAADRNRVYLASSVADAPIRCLVEGG